MLRQSLLAICTIGLVTSCTQPSGTANDRSELQGIRAMSIDEKTEDFDDLVKTFKELYGPLEYKEKRFGFKIDEMAQGYRVRIQQATSDIEVFGIMKEFVTRFNDGHVALESSMIAQRGHAVPIYLTPFGERAIIGKITDPSLEKNLNIAVGDEVLSIDGVRPYTFMSTISKYASFGNELTNAHNIRLALRRPVFIKELTPTKSHVELTIQKSDGTVIERSLVWEEVNETISVEKNFGTIPKTNSTLNVAYSEAAASLIHGSIADMANEVPFFATAQVMVNSKMVRIKPSAQALKNFGIEDASKAPDLFAAIYKFDGKTILLLRQANYMVPDPAQRIAWFKALLSEYVSLSDVIVVDQTHNPGGSLDYARDFMALFSNQKSKSLVNFLNGDRKWLDFFGTALQQLGPVKNENQEIGKSLEFSFKLVEQAYDSGGGLTKEPVSLGAYNYVNPANAVDGKPILLLINELAGSCGDIFPALMKANKLATLFGQRTMGLGGNVEGGFKLPNSQFSLNLTRGMFAVYSPDGNYPEPSFIENNGVLPDIEHNITVEDFRAGYTSYFKAFSKAAVGLTK